MQKPRFAMSLIHGHQPHCFKILGPVFSKFTVMKPGDDNNLLFTPQLEQCSKPATFSLELLAGS